MEQQREVKRPRTRPPAGDPGEPEPLPQQQQPQLQVGGALAASEDPSRVWLPDTVQRFAGFLTCNEVACVLRLVNKATAAQFRGPQHTTVRLSLPVPHREFVWRWGGRDAARSLTLSQRRLLPRLTASSGSIANLTVLLAWDDLETNLEEGLINAAAAAGQLEVCRWLVLQGCACGVGGDPARAAASGGHAAVCEWFIANNPALAAGHRMTCHAARGGHVGLLNWLLRVERGRLPNTALLLGEVAAGCDLPTLQRLLHAYVDSVPEDPLSGKEKSRVLDAAAASPTVDWRGKVECLEARGWPRRGHTCTGAAVLPDWRDRLEWLQQRGHRLTPAALEAAASAGRADALQYLLAEGVEIDEAAAKWAGRYAAKAGHVAVLQALASALGAPFVMSLHAAGLEAAEHGQLPVLSWLVETRGAAVALTAEVFSCAAGGSGSIELLAWLHERGCPWDASVFAAAAGSGSEEQLEWLAARGCPMGGIGAPYLRALDERGLALPRLQCLQRLGCPWGPAGSVFWHVLERCWGLKSAASCRAALRCVTWLVAQGCPVQLGDSVRQVMALLVAPNGAKRTLVVELMAVLGSAEAEARGGGAPCSALLC
ncbi:Ankyrin repeat domain-containing protein, partial [Tetrabaena socialis]